MDIQEIRRCAEIGLRCKKDGHPVPADLLLPTAEERSRLIDSELCLADGVTRMIPVQARNLALTEGARSMVVPHYCGPVMDYVRPQGAAADADIDPSWLVGAAKRIYEWCAKNGFKTRLEARHERQGEQGYAIIVEW